MDEKWSAEELIKEWDLKEELVLCIYLFGSRVYGTNNEKSDYDFVFIVRDEYAPDMENEKTIKRSFSNMFLFTSYFVFDGMYVWMQRFS